MMLLGASAALADTGALPLHAGMSHAAAAADTGGAPGASLQSLLALARQNNPDLAAVRREAEMASERVYPAGAFADPVVERELEIDNLAANGEHGAPVAPGSTRGGSIKYRVIQEIPFWGKRDLKREVAAAEADQFKGRSEKLWNEIAARMKGAYAQYYRVARVAVLTREILDLFAQLEQIAQARYSAGLVPQQDVIRAQTEQTRTRTELVGIETELRNWQYRLNAMLKRASTAALAQPEQPRPLPGAEKLDYPALVERMKEKNPQLFTEGAGITLAEKSRELTYRNRWPDGSLGVSTIYANNKLQLWGLYYRITIPLQQGSRRSREREAEAMVQAAQSRREAAENQLLDDLSENLAGLEAAREVDRLARTSLVPQAELTYQAALAGYQTSKVDFAVLLEAQRQIRNAKMEQLKAEADAQVRLAEIERVVGEDL